jgi:pyridinium-3,5-biscarboxylic acid mononucleotide sulfurtransferase
VRAAGVVIELDPANLDALDGPARAVLGTRIAALAPARLGDAPVRFAPYRTGSAFLTGGTLPAGGAAG